MPLCRWTTDAAADARAVACAERKSHKIADREPVGVSNAGAKHAAQQVTDTLTDAVADRKPVAVSDAGALLGAEQIAHSTAVDESFSLAHGESDVVAQRVPDSGAERAPEQIAYAGAEHIADVEPLCGSHAGPDRGSVAETNECSKRVSVK